MSPVRGVSDPGRHCEICAPGGDRVKGMRCKEHYGSVFLAAGEINMRVSPTVGDVVEVVVRPPSLGDLPLAVVDSLAGPPRRKLGARDPWLTVMMGVALAVSRRSRDETTRVGAVVCDATWTILGTGYNGPPASSDGALQMGGPDRHKWVIHAEENALLQAMSHAAGRRLPAGSRCFVTHRPCARCVARLSHAGVASATWGWDELSDEQRADAEEVEAKLKFTSGCSTAGAQAGV